MEDVQQSIPQLSFDKSPAEEIFSASVEAWKQNLEAFNGAPKPQPEQYGDKPEPQRMPLANSSAQPSPAGESIFLCMVREQMELCRFFERRWKQYLTLPAEISRCRSPVELAQLQFVFLTRMAADYGLKGRHIAQTFQDLASEATRLNPAPFMPKQLPRR